MKKITMIRVISICTLLTDLFFQLAFFGPLPFDTELRILAFVVDNETTIYDAGIEDLSLVLIAVVILVSFISVIVVLGRKKNLYTN